MKHCGSNDSSKSLLKAKCLNNEKRQRKLGLVFLGVSQLYGDQTGVSRGMRQSDQIDVDSLFPQVTAWKLNDIIHSIRNQEQIGNAHKTTGFLPKGMHILNRLLTRILKVGKINSFTIQQKSTREDEGQDIKARNLKSEIGQELIWSSHPQNFGHSFVTFQIKKKKNYCRPNNTVIKH